MQAALQLAEEYGLPVFPCRPDKRPYTEHGFKDATTNLDMIEEWWNRWPEALIGVPTGKASGLVVLDVDPDGLGWYQEQADKLSAGRIHRTRR
ncbi:MAG: bifunctional DNA primase/polymerase, partial [Pseudomonadota bacterium]|nr:bifunctional DNA primase/polymerase [Pseudomonadota bacterium]